MTKKHFESIALDFKFALMKEAVINYIDNKVPHKLTITYGLQDLRPGQQLPYFSVTGDIMVKRKGRWEEDRCGCIHEDILELSPGLKPLVDLHLSDINGKPMHSWENGEYFRKENKHAVAKKHLRMDDAEFAVWLKFLHQIENAKWYEDEEWEEKAKEDYTQFKLKVEKRWKIEAEEAIKKFELV